MELEDRLTDEWNIGNNIISQLLNCLGFLQRLRDGENVICAEGYLFVFERRGYLTAGSYVPEIVIEHPELVRQQYEEFVHAGSDVVLALTVSNNWACFKSVKNHVRRNV